ncbi:unnamed protein product [Paramecium sonneborni]|uniref:Uncharacterized protein n=1 Tax=Paramecium sonneborni TaxID=65129 RepID=A0A8S1KZI4_9CILI|nr:unnamed protein product [Paramecium sonneborni]
MEYNLDVYLNIPFKSTRYKKIGFTIPVLEERRVKGNFRSISFHNQKQQNRKAIIFPKLNSSYYLLKDEVNETKQGNGKQKGEKISKYLKRFLEPENASKSKLMRDLDYRKQIIKQMKTNQ